MPNRLMLVAVLCPAGWRSTPIADRSRSEPRTVAQLAAEGRQHIRSEETRLGSSWTIGSGMNEMLAFFFAVVLSTTHMHAAPRRCACGTSPVGLGAVYPCRMSTVTGPSESLRATISRHRGALDAIMHRYAATNPRLFGSVARGDARPDSDIDLLVDLLPDGGNELLRVSGIAEELSNLLGTRVDVVAASLLRGEVSSSALADAVAV